MQAISIGRAVATLELWSSEGVRVILVTETGATCDMRDGKIQVRKDMRPLVIHATDETSFVIWPDKFRACNLVCDDQSDGFAALRFVAEHGLPDVVLLAIAENNLLDIQTLLFLAAQTDGVAEDTEEEEELPEQLPEEEQEAEPDLDDQEQREQRPPFWPPRSKD